MNKGPRHLTTNHDVATMVHTYIYKRGSAILLHLFFPSNQHLAPGLGFFLLQTSLFISFLAHNALVSQNVHLVNRLYSLASFLAGCRFIISFKTPASSPHAPFNTRQATY